ncbi:Predicted dithiol-disulfide oxidoreductase, DUF899 family [Paenibacillus sp. UNC496MF]|uniref:DUF899 domain-containing protein n=1 Tax=Paenibacillus sp. UNC496MF TaxID=1502753 RepID=UPI0008E19082|nr:DUF899 domain-containing protein [Paenibacillus sp. UNC496MF]SFJ92689.1 Predicted dithiol-disulfide oxidoreductase, DUF899 family [Paenibacillus sp. UNC496MF]
MSLPEVVSYSEWLIARKELLKKEKEFTRLKDALNTERRMLPMVRIEKEYVFESSNGHSTLMDLFEGRRQLIVYHFMFDPLWEKGCSGCSSAMDQLSMKVLEQLNEHHTSFACVSRAPYLKSERYKQDMNWSFPWYSSFESDFNYDFHATLDASKAEIEYNYRDKAEIEKRNPQWFHKSTEMQGYSCFLRDGQEIYHTYSTYARGSENAGCHIYALLDMTALGRQEPWEKPEGRADPE